MKNVTWHRGIGADITSDMSISEQLEISGLNWAVHTSPVTYGLNMQRFTSDYRRAVYRADTNLLLDTCGKNWEPFQNFQILETFHRFCGHAGLTIDHLGALNEGRIIFASANLPHEINVRQVGDIVRARVLLLNHHTVGNGLQVRVQAERLVCANGMTMPVKIGNRVVNHVGVFDAIARSGGQEFS